MEASRPGGTGREGWEIPFSRRSALASLASITALGAWGCKHVFTDPQTDSQTLPDRESPQYVGEVSGVVGLGYVKVEGVALVTNLENTGSDPPPSSQRAQLINEMRTRNIRGGEHLLASSRTALAVVRAFLPPGVQKGDRIDVEIRTPPQSETTSLRGGWMMRTRLEEIAVLGGSIRRGHELAMAEGPVVVNSLFDSVDEEIQQTRGVILGGGVATTTRKLGLRIAHEFQTIRTAARIATAINYRFFVTDRGGSKQGVANAKNEARIELDVHPLYRHNLGRFLRVIGALSLEESTADRARRIVQLEKDLLDPKTAAATALRLEAVGKDASEALARGLQSEHAEVRFFASEALAYLRDSRATPTLVEFAKREPALRWHALTALSAIGTLADMSAHEGLVDLLSVDSAETRYGAFMALRAMNEHDPLVRGEILGDGMALHEIRLGGPPLVHLARRRRPEVVLFGREVRLLTPFYCKPNRRMIVIGEDGPNGEPYFRITRYASDGDDEKKTASAKLADVIHAMVSLGGDYSDVLQLLQQAQDSNLDARLVVDALPRPDRPYRNRTQRGGAESPVGTGVSDAGPTPSLFGRVDGEDAASAAEPETEEPLAESDPSEESAGPSAMPWDDLFQGLRFW